MLIIDRFKDLYAFRSTIGLEVTLDLSEDIFVTKLTKNKSTIHIDDTSSCSSIKELDEFYTKHNTTPVSLLLHGKGVLIKSFSVSDPDKEELTEVEIQSLIPSFSKEDFYTSQLRGDNIIWLAFVKKTSLEGLLSELQKIEIKPLQIFIGPFVLSTILSQLNVYGDTFIFARHHILLSANKKWVEYKNNPEFINPFHMKVGDRLIKQEYLTAYATAFSTLMNEYVFNHAIDELSSQAHFLEAKEKIKFRINGLIILSLFFVSLFINALLFNHYYTRNNQLESDISVQSISDKELLDITEQSRSYETILQDLGWNGGISKAYLLDQIGLSLIDYPSISITNLAINPSVKKSINTQVNSPTDHRNTIHLSGKVLNLDVLNSWTRELNHMEWVESVRISKFNTSEESTHDTYNTFKIELKFHAKI